MGMQVLRLSLSRDYLLNDELPRFRGPAQGLLHQPILRPLQVQYPDPTIPLIPALALRHSLAAAHRLVVGACHPRRYQMVLQSMVSCGKPPFQVRVCRLRYRPSTWIPVIQIFTPEPCSLHIFQPLLLRRFLLSLLRIQC